MNEKTAVVSVFAGETGTTLSTLFAYWYSPPYPITIIYATAAPNADDTGLTIDLNDDGTAVIDGLVCDDKDVPGTWKSTHVGGTNAPIRVAANSLMSLDANSAAANTAVNVQYHYLVGE